MKLIRPRMALAAPRLARLAPQDCEAEAPRVRPNWYQTSRWQRLRLSRLRHDRWMCQQTGAPLVGRYPAWNSAAVDHVVPHRWDERLFWDFDNLQSVTKRFHDSAKQRLERAGDL